MGTGRGTGDKRAVEAAQQAISSPLLEDVSINGATGILINITGGPDLTLAEMNEACSLIEEAGRSRTPTSSSARSSTRTPATRFASR